MARKAKKPVAVAKASIESNRAITVIIEIIVLREVDIAACRLRIYRAIAMNEVFLKIVIFTDGDILIALCVVVILQRYAMTFVWHIVNLVTDDEAILIISVFLFFGMEDHIAAVCGDAVNCIGQASVVFFADGHFFVIEDD